MIKITTKKLIELLSLDIEKFFYAETYSQEGMMLNDTLCLTVSRDHELRVGDAIQLSIEIEDDVTEYKLTDTQALIVLDFMCSLKLEKEAHIKRQGEIRAIVAASHTKSTESITGFLDTPTTIALLIVGGIGLLWAIIHFNFCDHSKDVKVPVKSKSSCVNGFKVDSYGNSQRILNGIYRIDRKLSDNYYKVTHYHIYAGRPTIDKSIVPDSKFKKYDWDGYKYEYVQCPKNWK